MRSRPDRLGKFVGEGLTLMIRDLPPGPSACASNDALRDGDCHGFDFWTSRDRVWNAAVAPGLKGFEPQRRYGRRSWGKGLSRHDDRRPPLPPKQSAAMAAPTRASASERSSPAGGLPSQEHRARRARHRSALRAGFYRSAETSSTCSRHHEQHGSLLSGRSVFCLSTNKPQCWSSSLPGWR